MTGTHAPTDRLQASLEAQQWNQVLALLAEGPYRVVMPIMQRLIEQLHHPQPGAAGDDPGGGGAGG